MILLKLMPILILTIPIIFFICLLIYEHIFSKLKMYNRLYECRKCKKLFRWYQQPPKVVIRKSLYIDPYCIYCSNAAVDKVYKEDKWMKYGRTRKLKLREFFEIKAAIIAYEKDKENQESIDRFMRQMED